MHTGDQGWSDALKEATRRAVEGLDFDSDGEVVCFKHVTSGFGVIQVTDLLGGKLRMIDRKTKQETTFTDASELIRAGWAID